MEEDNMYDYCPLCGINWKDDSKNHKCELMRLVDSKKPRFYITDLTNYSNGFLKEIIKWQNMKIRTLLGEDASTFDLGLKDNNDIINSFKARKKTENQ